MAINIGIVGLPNVGKSTLFNALAAGGAAASENFPFCTIEPNVGSVGVPDRRLEKLAALANSERILPTSVEFVDIAGIVSGASKGEGLGNKFLSHIREVNAILHVVRCFEDENVVHVDGSVDPIRDIEVIDTELALADIATVEKRLQRNVKIARSGDAKAKEEVTVLTVVLEKLQAGVAARAMELEDSEMEIVRPLCLLTGKPVMFVANVSEEDVASGDNDYVKALKAHAETQNARSIVICAAIESEIAQLDVEERQEYLKSMGLEYSGLEQVIKESYRLLNLITFLTVGPKETRAWTVREGSTAPQAAGVIHSDFERGFIKAEVMRWEDLLALGSEAAVRADGKLGIEGKEYVVKDGDVMHFRFNV